MCYRKDNISYRCFSWNSFLLESVMCVIWIDFFRAIWTWNLSKQHANLKFLEGENVQKIQKGHCVRLPHTISVDIKPWMYFKFVQAMSLLWNISAGSLVKTSIQSTFCKNVCFFMFLVEITNWEAWLELVHMYAHFKIVLIDIYIWVTYFSGSWFQIFKYKWLKTELNFSLICSCNQLIFTKYNILKKLQEQQNV